MPAAGVLAAELVGNPRCLPRRIDEGRHSAADPVVTSSGTTLFAHLRHLECSHGTTCAPPRRWRLCRLGSSGENGVMPWIQSRFRSELSRTLSAGGARRPADICPRDVCPGGMLGHVQSTEVQMLSTRDRGIVLARDRGDTTVDLGALYGVSHQRISAVVSNANELEARCTTRPVRLPPRGRTAPPTHRRPLIPAGLGRVANTDQSSAYAPIALRKRLASLSREAGASSHTRRFVHARRTRARGQPVRYHEQKIPARHRLLGLLAAALVLLCAGPVASAGAQNWFRLARIRVTFAHGAGASHTRQGGST